LKQLLRKAEFLYPIFIPAELSLLVLKRHECLIVPFGVTNRSGAAMRSA
jgi:hypothetical protein